MLQNNPKITGQEDLFRPRLETFIDMNDPWVKLSKVIDWDSLEKDLSSYYCADNGRPGSSIRLMVGLCIIKDKLGLSNEGVCAIWRRDPGYQYFCGEEYYHHHEPVQPPSISNFRTRIGEAGHERILAATVEAGLATGVIEECDLEEVTVDTTVQEKAVKFPTDTQLSTRAREELIKRVKQYRVHYRQSYLRVGKEAQIMVGRYISRRKMKEARKQMKDCRKYLGRVIRDIERGIEKDPSLEPHFREDLNKAQTIFNQMLNPKVKGKDKLYSWHAPEVE